MRKPSARERQKLRREYAKQYYAKHPEIWRDYREKTIKKTIIECSREKIMEKTSKLKSQDFVVRRQGFDGKNYFAICRKQKTKGV
jgi:hypothetical protein